MKNTTLIEYVFGLAAEGIEEEWFVNGTSKKWYNYVVNLPERLRSTYLIGVLNAQITNGGFNQYFVNGYGQFVFETIECLKAIGSGEIAILLSKALDRINIENLDPIIFRERLLNGEIERLYEDDDLDDFLMTLDNEFLELQEGMEKNLSLFLK